MKVTLRLAHFPISFFAPALGFAGFTLAVFKTNHIFLLPIWFKYGLLLWTIFLFLLVCSLYIVKILIYYDFVKKEFFHPVKINFFPLVSKTLLVLSIIFLSVDINVSRYLWIIGVILNSVFSFVIISEWTKRDHFKISHLSPAWFIPVVGNIIIPIVGVNYASPEVLWFFFSVGVIWMFILTTIIFNRIIFHKPLSEKLMPTNFILFAAPAIAFIAYYKLSHSLDAFAYMLYNFSLFLFVLIFFQWKLFYKIKFYLSWWAYTFPLAAFFLATNLMFEISGIEAYRQLAIFVLFIFVVILIVLIITTVKAIVRGAICVEEE